MSATSHTEYRQLEDVLRVLVIVGLATWAGWAFMVGLRAEQGRVNEASIAHESPYSAQEDENAGASAR
jgi:hypothetical protein